MPVQSTNIVLSSGTCLTYTQTEMWQIASGVLLSTGSGAGVHSSFVHSTLINSGNIQTKQGVAVQVTGQMGKVVNAGQMSGGEGVALGQDGYLANQGDITGTGVGVRIGADGQIYNGGHITGYTAIVAGPGTTVVNQGTITSTGDSSAAPPAPVGTAILATGGSLDVANVGEIYGHLVSRTKADDEVYNTGTIFGDVVLGKGSDLYDGRGGSVLGAVHGKGGADTILGGAEGEVLNGGAGRDLIRGGGGDDLIDGGKGRDKLEGGAGNDTFVFAHPGKVDRVVDFDAAEDLIQLENKAFRKLGGEGPLAEAAFHIGPRATEEDHRIIYDQNTGLLFHDRNGDAGGGVTKIAKLASGLDLTHHHFEIV